MPLIVQEPDRRDTSQYRAFKRRIRRERPICEHCCISPTEVIAHVVQPLLGGGLMDDANVLALCKPCDRLNTRSKPDVRRRPQRRETPWPN